MSRDKGHQLSYPVFTDWDLSCDDLNPEGRGSPEKLEGGFTEAMATCAKT
jgi:hypothetical protein